MRNLEGFSSHPLGSWELWVFTGAVPRLSDTATLLHPGRREPIKGSLNGSACGLTDQGYSG